MKHPRKLQWHYPPSYLWGQRGGMSVMGRDIRQLSNQQRWHALLYELASYSGNVLRSYASRTKIILAVNVYSLMGNCVWKILKPENSFGPFWWRNPVGGCQLVTSMWWHSWAGCIQASIVESHLRTSTYQGTHQAWHALCLSEASWMTCTLIVEGLVRFFAPPKSALAAIFSKHIRHVWNWQILDLGLGESELAFDRCILNGMYSCLYLYLYLYLYLCLCLHLHLCLFPQLLCSHGLRVTARLSIDNKICLCCIQINIVLSIGPERLVLLLALVTTDNQATTRL